MKETIYTAHVGTNAELFPNVLKLFVPKGSKIIDVTCGTGVFWRNVSNQDYDVILSDLKQGVDLAKLPIPDKSMDCLVIDPPYMPTEYTGIKEFGEYYGIVPRFTDKKWDKAVLELYHNGINEATRVLKDKGVLIVKCQDTVCANKQVLMHNDIIEYCKEKYICEDLFVLVQTNKRPHPKKNQLHARKNHSYFLVFIKKKEKIKK